MNVSHLVLLLASCWLVPFRNYHSNMCGLLTFNLAQFRFPDPTLTLHLVSSITHTPKSLILLNFHSLPVTPLQDLFVFWNTKFTYSIHSYLPIFLTTM